LIREPAIDEAFDRNEAFTLYQSNREAFIERARRTTQERAMGGA
jgi:hypothetical protein